MNMHRVCVCCLAQWFVYLRQINPGRPPKLYAMAYKLNDQVLENAAAWMLDSAEAYLNEHKGE